MDNSDKKIIIFFILLLTTVFVLLSTVSIISFSYYKKHLKTKVNTTIDSLTKTPTEEFLNDTDVNIQKDNSTSDSNVSVELNLKEEISSVTNNSTTQNNQVQTQKPKTTYQNPPCIQYLIKEGSFASNKCYSPEDYEDLVFYLNEYRNAQFDYNAAKARAEVTCEGFTDEFKKICEESKDEMDKEDEKMDEYSEKIKYIISKGEPL